MRIRFRRSLVAWRGQYPALEAHPDRGAALLALSVVLDVAAMRGAPWVVPAEALATLPDAIGAGGDAAVAEVLRRGVALLRTTNILCPVATEKGEVYEVRVGFDLRVDPSAGTRVRRQRRRSGPVEGRPEEGVGVTVNSSVTGGDVTVDTVRSEPERTTVTGTSEVGHFSADRYRNAPDHYRNGSEPVSRVSTVTGEVFTGDDVSSPVGHPPSPTGREGVPSGEDRTPSPVMLLDADELQQAPGGLKALEVLRVLGRDALIAIRDDPTETLVRRSAAGIVIAVRTNRRNQRA